MDLKKHIWPFGYEPARITPGLWRHNKNIITFKLVLDEFGIKQNRKEDAQNLITALQERYEVAQDWTGSLYSGITLNWDYNAKIMDIFIKGCVK